MTIGRSTLRLVDPEQIVATDLAFSESDLRLLGHNAMEEYVNLDLEFENDPFIRQGSLSDDAELTDMEINLAAEDVKTLTESSAEQPDRLGADTLTRMLNHPILFPKKLNKLAKLASEGDMEATTQVIEHSMLWVSKIARKKQTRDFGHEDLVQEGVFGLILATKQYDYSRGYSFINYATFKISRAMQQAIRNKKQTIRIPDGRWNDVRNLDQTDANYYLENHCLPTYDQLSEITGISLDIIENINRTRRLKKSLDAPIITPDGVAGTLGDRIPDNSTNVEEAALENIAVEQLRRHLHCLGPNQKRAISLRFGLEGNEEHSYSALGKKLGVSERAARTLIKNALVSLRGLYSLPSTN